MTSKRWLIAAGVVVFLLVGGGWYTCGFRGCPDPETLLAYEPGGAPQILDRNGEPFATLLPVQREVVVVDSLPEHVGQAFIAVEDRRFRRHRGVDPLRVLGAFVANVREGGVAEGGSTITMQLARNAFPDRLPATERSLRRKVAETRVAVDIENTFDKDQILGLYLNQIYFGNGATGIAAASRHYFGIPPTELSPAQSALLAAMVKAPAHYDPRDDEEEALERRNLVLDLMGRAGFLTAEEVEAAKESEMEVVPRRRATDAGETLPAPWFLEALRRRLDDQLGSDMYGNEVRVRSTLDARLQAAAEEALQAQLRRAESGELGSYRGAPYDPDQPPDSAGSQYLQGAVVVLDARTGDVLALVGGRNYRHSTFDHVFNARRQVGSAFKPFVYGAALAHGIPASHTLVDEPISIEQRGSPTYRPENYDDAFRGPMPAREALRQSRNVPTVRLGQEVGTDAVADFAREAGMDAEIPETPSMVLGTVTLSPMELATTYATFAALGRSVEPRFFTTVERGDGRTIWRADEPEPEERIDAAVAYVLTDMLRDVVDGGTGSAVRSAGFSGPAAGKTGTTQDAADVWFAGYTPEVVGVVWIGFDQPAEILPRATGGGLAAPIWGRMMAGAERSGAEWEEPAGVVRLPYDPATGRAIAGDCPAAAGAPTDLFIEEHVSATCPARLGPPDTLADSLGGFDTLFDSLRVPDSLRTDTAARTIAPPDTAGAADTTPRPDTTPRRDTTPPPDTIDTLRTAPPDTSEGGGGSAGAGVPGGA